MRYALIIPDGAADLPDVAYGGKTAFEAAKIPHMDRLAGEGVTGLARTVPAGMQPGSDVANLSIFGYDPANSYTGRAPLEAASMGLTLRTGQAVFRANMINVCEGILEDYAAGHIPTEQAEILIEYLDANLSLAGVHLHAGKSYRHLCTIGHKMADDIPTRDAPHDIVGQPIKEHDPVSLTENHLRLLDIEKRTRDLLKDHEINEQRVKDGAPAVSQLWLWGGGVMPTLAQFTDTYAKRGALISAVDLLQGIGTLAGLAILDVPGITGYYDTDYRAKGAAAVEALKSYDFVAVHVEAPDEAGHAGDSVEKVRALENIDTHIVGPLLQEAQRAGDLRILCLPDHPTPLATRVHSNTPIPFAMWGPGFAADETTAFSESAMQDAVPVAGMTLLGRLFAD